MLELKFTIEDWRLIAIACARVKKSAFMNPEKSIKRLRSISNEIASETGKSGLWKNPTKTAEERDDID